MRTRTRTGLVALFAVVAMGAMLGFQQAAAPKVDPRIEALNRELRNAEDQLAEAETQVKFWQQEAINQDTDVSRLTAETDASPCTAFFLDRAKGLANRAAHSGLDARLRQALCARKVQAIKAELIGQ